MDYMRIMNIVMVGGAGFIGTNLVIALSKNGVNRIKLVSKNIAHFDAIKSLNLPNVFFEECLFDNDKNYDAILEGQDILYHLSSTTVPTTCNQRISAELDANVIFSSLLFEACVRQKVKKVAFISSGGTVYGREFECPLSEETPLKPISSYGLQKVAIENLLYLYRYMYGLDYRIIRLSNPYGPYQRPNGVLGAVTTFTYKALHNETIHIYGDGSVVRDFIYIDDAIKGILNIVNGETDKRTFNLGCGYGTSIKEVVEKVIDVVGDVKVSYESGRRVDVPINYLDISRYENYFGKLNPITLEDGIRKTVEFIKRECEKNYKRM